MAGTLAGSICWGLEVENISASQSGSSIAILTSKLTQKTRLDRFKVHLDQDYFYSNGAELLNRGANRYKLGLDLKIQNLQKTHILDVNYIYSGIEKEHYVNLREWNYKRQLSNNQFLSVGRKLHDWSRADQVWQLGVWQPRFMWSRIRPEQNGLTGLFYSWVGDKLQIEAFASPLFVPELGPRFRFSNGGFQSENPWFKAPAKRATVEGFFEDRDISYGFNMPRLQELVAQNSVAIQGRWGQDGYFCQTGYAYKPRNGIFNSVDLLLRIDLPGSPPGVEVHPYTEYHRLLSVECGHEGESGLYGFVSLTQDNPLRQARAENWISKGLQKTSLATGLVGYKLGAHNIYLSSMSLTGGDDLDVGTKASERESFFESWYNYVQAFRLGYSGKLDWQRSIEVQAAMTWDSFQQGWSWTSGFHVNFTQALEIFFRFDGIALAESSRSEGSTQFLNTFKTNDQATAGVYFVF